MIFNYLYCYIPLSPERGRRLFIKVPFQFEIQLKV